MILFVGFFAFLDGKFKSDTTVVTVTFQITDVSLLTGAMKAVL